MNLLAFGIIAAMPFLTVFALNFEAMHGYYAYDLPVAGSTVDIYQPYYLTVAGDDCNYWVSLSSGGKTVRHYPMSECTGQGALAIRRITAIDNETIWVDFSDNDETITRSKTGETYKPMPPFSHAETITVNQTFVAMCNNKPPSWLLEGEVDNSTGILVFQYLGQEVHKVTKVQQFLPAAGSGASDEAARGYPRHETSWVELDPPKDLLTHKLLFMSVSTPGKIQCDFPQIIERTIDSKKVDPDGIRAVSGWLYEWYRGGG